MAKLLYKAPDQRESLRLVTGIPMHLSAAGLACREINRMAQPLEHLDDGLARLWKQGVVITGNKQGDLQDLTSKQFSRIWFNRDFISRYNLSQIR